MDLENVEHWQHLLVGEPIHWRQNPEDRDDADQDEPFDPIKAEKHLDIITSWVEPLRLEFNGESIVEVHIPNSRKLPFLRPHSCLTKSKDELNHNPMNARGLLKDLRLALINCVL